MRSTRTYLPLLASVLLCACSAVPDAGRSPTVSLPLHQAWFDGRKVDYVTTDISDLAMAQALGVNLVPRLALALPAPGRPSLVERVYKFVDDSQITVFQSAPSPTGPGNTDTSYSPLWRMVLVKWKQPAQARELKSEEQILSAVEAQELSLQMTDIIVNCPITRSVDGRAIAGAK